MSFTSFPWSIRTVFCPKACLSMFRLLLLTGHGNKQDSSTPKPTTDSGARIDSASAAPAASGATSTATGTLTGASRAARRLHDPAAAPSAATAPSTLPRRAPWLSSCTSLHRGRVFGCLWTGIRMGRLFCIVCQIHLHSHRLKKSALLTLFPSKQHMDTPARNISMRTRRSAGWRASLRER